jgi:hypothetical protein
MRDTSGAMPRLPDTAKTFLGGLLTTLLFVLVIAVSLGAVFLVVSYLAGPVGG